jgi:hypothetical protein
MQLFHPSSHAQRRFLLLLFAMSLCYHSAAQGCERALPFSTDSNHILVWNGSDYVPIFLKGTNLGVSVPSTFPGQMDASREQYARWLWQIKDAGFNCIRVYTLHFPRFYEVLDSFNRAHPQSPIYVFHGVWLEEDVPGFNHDITFMEPWWQNEMRENIDCVHGRRSIPQRAGKAYGEYSVDVSRWVMGWVIGREVEPTEILNANTNHPADTTFIGKYFSIRGVTPAEAWIVKHFDYLVDYEQTNYGTMRPICFSSWPTLDPLYHPAEKLRVEDTAWIDLSQTDISRAPAGMFVSYHAYPYYPDFISKTPVYQQYSDHEGPNSYVGYLSAMKSHYRKFPLVIAEFGVPSSWGIAHYAHSGMHHGGFDQLEQGKFNMRMFYNFQQTNCAGGFQFAWIDEWFKRTWIADPFDYDMNARVLWHNITAAEQNFGLIGFGNKDTLWKAWDVFCFNCPVREIKARAGFDFFEMKIDLDRTLDVSDTLWISLDTYADSLGESVLPSGDTVQQRAEFYLRITNYSAELFVTEAYDLYGIWHKVSPPYQHYRSLPSDGGNWRLVRWKNNDGQSEVQYIGNLKVNKYFLPKSSRDGVRIFPGYIQVRLPWSLINFVDPSSRRVMHDDRSTWPTEDAVSDGIHATVFYKGFKAAVSSRFLWPTWGGYEAKFESVEYTKDSYEYMKKMLPDISSPVIARCDTYTVAANLIFVAEAERGLLQNDEDLDKGVMLAYVAENPRHGRLNLNLDGSFTYVPDWDYLGPDKFRYAVYDGNSLSRSNVVYLDVSGFISGMQDGSKQAIKVFPNPVFQTANVVSSGAIDHWRLLRMDGRELMRGDGNGHSLHIDVSGLAAGMYLLHVMAEGRAVVERVSVLR